MTTRMKNEPGEAPQAHLQQSPMAGLPVLNLEQIQSLRRSFGLIEPQAQIAALVFYRHLFTLEPALKKMFQTSIELQSRKLMEALSYTINTLEDPTALLPVLAALGRRHVSYGVRDEHYDIVVQAMLLMLQETLGSAFDADTRQAWITALGFVASTMKRGAANAAPVLTDSSDSAKHH